MDFEFSPLFSSSSGNATFVNAGGTNILIDAGTTGAMLCDALCSLGKRPESIEAILVTHEHSDHVKGVGVFSRKFDVPVYANAKTWEAMAKKVGNISEKNIRIIDKNEFYIGNVCAAPFSLSHDAVDPVGYAVMAGNKKIGVLTDTGKVTSQMLGILEGASVVLLESNHDIEMLQNGMYPYYLKKRILSTKGHLSNMDAGSISIELLKKGVRGILLGHISSQNNHKQLAYDTVSQILEEAGAKVGRDIALMAARRKSVTGLFPLK